MSAAKAPRSAPPRASIKEWFRRNLTGKTERRLATIILLTTMLPLVAALYLVNSMFEQASSLWFNPEIGEQLDRGVDVYKDYVKAVKDDLKHQTVAIAADPVLREAAKKRNIETLESELDALFPHFPELVSLAVLSAPPTLEKGDPKYDAEIQQKTMARRDRGRPVDPSKEKSLDVTRPLSEDEENGPALVATFAVSSQRLGELESAGTVVARYHQLEASRGQLYKAYVRVFGLLLTITALAALVLGIVLARGLTRRINRLGAAINVVAQGDLSVRVPVTGSDELTDLARTFNRMIAEMAQSRARIEFLQRVGAWQDMAQRLAHEIKNPLTPIQLAVQEAHKKYAGDDPRYRQLLDTTLEIVEEEVGTLRRLVGDFSNFARLPHAELVKANLSDFLRDCETQLGHLEDPSLGEASADNEPIPAQNVEIRWEAPAHDVEVAIDRQMLRRVMVNLVRNAVQAIRDAHRRKSSPGSDPNLPTLGVIGHVVVSAEKEENGARIVVEDDGPGIADSVRGRIFDPYFTTKSDGTGLGLAIVKKVVVEHGGEIEATKSHRLGGARFVLHLPGIRILAVAEAAKEARERARKQGVETSD
ncbi:MAG: HAMP domain-containing protein [Deltaproteobacteria bacterium]|nr:HAMP domain-containing protein [Deltaproteobacteria bacterium]